MREAGTLKRIPVLRSAQGPVVEIEGRGQVLCLCSNDYLGLADHPEVVRAGTEGFAYFGAGTASVRFICGTFTPHLELERDLAAFAGTEAALTYVSCWNANAALLDALCDERTAVFSDRLNHASIIDGMRLARPAHKAVYEHGDPDDLRRALAEAPASSRRLIITDGVFSMEGDLAPMPELGGARARVRGDADRGRLARDRCPRRDGSRRARALRAPGPRRRDPHRHARQGARGAAGGFVAGSEALCGMLEQRSRPQLFSNGIPPAVACSARRALAELREHPELVARLRANTRAMRAAIAATGLEPVEGESAIVPIIVGETAAAIRMSERLLELGVYVTGFGYPVVPEGTARVRIQVSAALTQAQLEQAAAALERAAIEQGLLATAPAD